MVIIPMRKRKHNEGIHKDTIRDACPAGIGVRLFMEKEAHYFDAILMDIRMPVMDGYQATDAIRAMERPDADIPIVAMTADAFHEDIKRCLEHGMNGHVAKPIDIKEVSSTLARCFEDRKK